MAIISCFRASTSSDDFGFAQDLRRLNVALSRGACCFILANYHQFKGKQGWKELIDIALKEKLCILNADQLQFDKEQLELTLQSKVCHHLDDL